MRIAGIDGALRVSVREKKKKNIRRAWRSPCAIAQQTITSHPETARIPRPQSQQMLSGGISSRHWWFHGSNGNGRGQIPRPSPAERGVQLGCAGKEVARCRCHAAAFVYHYRQPEAGGRCGCASCISGVVVIGPMFASIFFFVCV